MNALKGIVEETAGKFEVIDAQRSELKQAIAINEQKYKSAEAILDVKSMKAYGRELEEDKGILETLEARRAATIEQDGSRFFQQLTQAAQSDMAAANDSQEERRAKVRALLQEAGEVLDKIEAAESAAVEQIREYTNTAALYLPREKKGLVSNIAGLAGFYGIRSQKDAIKEALKQF